jgi:ribulose-bisphosphate carboxylase large chain
MVNPAYCSLVERTKAVCDSLDRSWRFWKKNVPFYANISGRPDKVRDLADQAIAAGARGLYVNAVTSGFSSLRSLRETFEMPLIAGRDMYALLSRPGGSGISLSVLGKLARITGADMFFVGSVAGKLRNDVVEIQALVRALTQDRMGEMQATLPLVSCGVHPGNVHLNIALLGKTIAFQAGGGIHGHPKGTMAGARAMRAAISLAERGIPLEDYEGHRGAMALGQALDKWNIFSVSDSIRGLAVVDFTTKHKNGT